MHHGGNLLWLWWIHTAKQTACNLRGTLCSVPRAPGTLPDTQIPARPQEMLLYA